MSYESRRNNNEINTPKTHNKTNNTSLPSPKERERRQREKSSSKAIKGAATGAANAFAGPVGGKAVDLASKTKTGQQLLNKGGQVLNKMPGVGKTLNKIDNLTNKAKPIPSKENNNINQATPTNNNPNSDEQNNIPNQNNNIENKGPGYPPSPVAEQSDSEADTNSSPRIAGLGPFSRKNNSKDKENSNEEETTTAPGKVAGRFMMSIGAKIVLLVAPIVIIIVIIVSLVGSVVGGVGDFVDALGAMFTAGGETGDVEVAAPTKEQEDFYNRINDVKLEYQANGKSVDPLKIAAVYRIFFSEKVKYGYKDMTEKIIKDIADCMFMGNSYDEEVFKENLTEYLIPKYYPRSSDDEREEIVNEIFEYMESYYSLIGEETDSACASVGTCIYDIKGFYIPVTGNINKSMNISNLMVRLMECGPPYGTGNDNTPIDQPLVPFEDYIMGVAYGEVYTTYDDEAIKAQMVAARSYALSRATSVGNAGGKKLEQEDGEWILQISSCVADQVFCNVDEGCSYMGGGDGQGGIVRSGIIPGAVRTMPALPADHKLRALAAEVQGEVLVNNQGNIMYTGFGSGTQRKMNELAQNGLNYRQILMELYGSAGATDIEKGNCNTGDSCSSFSSSGPYASWKQYTGPWTDVPLGKSDQTIKSAGCLVTSVAMLIAKSGVPTKIEDFNPGTFVEFLNKNNGFSGANFLWASVSSVAPSFTYQGKISVTGKTKKEKKNILEGLLQSGNYVVAEVKGSTGQHWVAIDGISADGKILMMDPGSDATDMWGQYSWKNTSQFSYFSVN